MDLQTASYLEIRIAMLRKGVTFRAIGQMINEDERIVAYVFQSRHCCRRRKTPARYARIVQTLALALQDGNGHVSSTIDLC